MASFCFVTHETSQHEMSTELCKGRTSEPFQTSFPLHAWPIRHCGTRPADTWGTGNHVTATVSLARTLATVERPEWWDSPTVLHAPFAPNLHASRTETSLEPVVVCAQSSPGRHRTVCVARPRRSPARVCCFLVVGAAVRTPHSVLPVRFFRRVRVNRQADRQTPSPPPPYRLPFAAIACTYFRSPPPPCTLRAAVKK